MGAERWVRRWHRPPGAATKIRIRGSSTISGNREPLWVVDGFILEDPVQISAEELNSLDNVNLIGNAISSLNPQDIERIDVLKDASATVMYGVKAANGVILIKTKQGQAGRMSVNYSGDISITPRLTYEKMNLMNSGKTCQIRWMLISHARWTRLTRKNSFLMLQITYSKLKKHS